MFKSSIFSIKIFVLALLTSFAFIAQAEYREGIHYIELAKENQFTLSKQPEVVEFFYYGCPHCRNIHPLVEDWLKTKPARVDFHYQPAFYSPRIQWSVQMYYVAYVLKKHKQLQGEIFTRYSQGKLRSRNDIYSLFASVGVSKEKVDETYQSFAVKSLMNKARELTQQSEIEGVPSFIVKGKYRVSSRTAGSPREIFKVIDFLLKNG